MTKQFKKLLITSILLIMGSTGSALAVSLPGIPESGPLNFNFDDAMGPAGSLKEALWKIKHNRAELTQLVPGVTMFSAVNAGQFIFTDKNYNQFKGNGNFTLNAYFGSDGTFTGGKVSITGTIGGIGINSTQLLMSADLSGFATANGLVGFATTNVVCNPVYAADCFLNESVYLNTSLSTGTDGLGSLKPSSISSSMVTSLTTVPLPASLWLLVSAMGAAMGISRRTTRSATVL